MWVFILDILGVLGEGLTQHPWPGILFLLTTLLSGERTFSYQIRQGQMLQSSWTRAVPIWSEKCFCGCYCCYFGVHMRIPFSAKFISGGKKIPFGKRMWFVIFTLQHMKWRLLVLSKHEGQYLSEIQYLLSVIQCLNFQVVLFVFSILFLIAFMMILVKRSASVKHARKTTFCTIPHLEKCCLLKTFWDCP